MKQGYLSKDLADKFRYLEFLYNITHPQAFCSSLPHQFFVESTNYCNCRCEMCIQKEMKRKRGKMEFSLFKKIVDEVSFFNPYFDFCGQGEPLLHPQIDKMVKYAVDAGMTKTRFYTNGTFLKKDLAERLINSGLKILGISFNGWNAESYERYQKGVRFEQTMSNILQFLRLKYEMQSSTPSVEISVVLYDELPKRKSEILHFFRDIPIDRIRFSSLINFFGKNKDPMLMKNIHRPYSEWPICKAPFRFFNIKWNGDVPACFMDYDGKYIVGNTKNEKILDIWNNDELRYFRQCLIEKRFDLIEEKANKFCSACNCLWMNPADHSPQYPKTFEQGAKEFFESNKTQAGKFRESLLKSGAEVARQYKYFMANYKEIEDEILAR